MANDGTMDVVEQDWEVLRTANRLQMVLRNRPSGWKSSAKALLQQLHADNDISVAMQAILEWTLPQESLTFALQTWEYEDSVLFFDDGEQEWLVGALLALS